MATIQERGFAAIARGLREYGYSDVSTAMVRETYEALKAGKYGMDGGEALPHGIISAFAESQMRDHPDIFPDLPPERR